LSLLTKQDDAKTELNLTDLTEQKQMRTAVLALQSKKAKNIQVINISKVTTIATYFVIASGTSATHLKALADTVEDAMRLEGEKMFRCNGKYSAKWILLDYSEVIVHLFLEDERIFYGLERLWSDGFRVVIEEESVS